MWTHPWWASVKRGEETAFCFTWDGKKVFFFSLSDRKLKYRCRFLAEFFLRDVTIPWCLFLFSDNHLIVLKWKNSSSLKGFFLKTGTLHQNNTQLKASLKIHKTTAFTPKSLPLQIQHYKSNKVWNIIINSYKKTQVWYINIFPVSNPSLNVSFCSMIRKN